MGDCLNILERPEVFIPTAALIVIVLLVWAQLSAHGDPDKNLNLVLGFVWTYLAILFTLVAVALFLYDNTGQFAKGFLVLSFLMTLFNILLSLFIIALRIFKKDQTFDRPLTRVTMSDDLKKKGVWIAFWIVALIGLIIITLSIIDILKCYCSYIGIVVLLVDAFYAVVLIGMGHISRGLPFCFWFKWYRESTKREIKK